MEDLYVAYRKAKHEAFRSSNTACGLAFAIYEDSLVDNLESLYQQLYQPKANWPYRNNLANLTSIPKGVEEMQEASEYWHFSNSDPHLEWRRQFADSNEPYSALQYRKIIEPSVDLMVISCLWVLKVGSLLDSLLDGSKVYANRVTRWSGKPDYRSHKLFRRWRDQYKKWQQSWMSTIHNDLRQGRSVVLFSLDISSFYHSIDVGCLATILTEKLSGIGNSDDVLFTDQLLAFFDNWNKVVANESRGIPVGLTCSAVIANTLLSDLDKDFSALQARSYSRYVDDIVLVVGDPLYLQSGLEAVKWLTNNVNSLVLSSDNMTLSIQIPGHPELIVSRSKFRCLALSGESGLDLLNAMKEQFQARASEQRLREPLESTSIEIGKRALILQDSGGAIVSDLRAAATVSLRRAALTQMLQLMQQYRNALPRHEWELPRKHFIGLFVRHCLTFRNLPVYFNNISFLLSLLASCDDFEGISLILDKLVNLRLVDGADGSDLWWRNIAFIGIESCYVSGDVPGEILAKFVRLGNLRDSDTVNFTPNLHMRLVGTDWGLLAAFEYLWKDGSFEASNDPCPSSLWRPEYSELIEGDLIRWEPIVFPTRPPTVLQLSKHLSLQRLKDVNRYLEAFSGYKLPELQIHDAPTHIQIGSKSHSKRRNGCEVIVAVTSFHTEDFNHNDTPPTGSRSLSRFDAFKRCISDALRSYHVPDYLVFPELCMPAEWMPVLSEQLSHYGVSLIAGLEYEMSSCGRGYMNRSAMVLCPSELEGVSVQLYSQKRRPAWSEAHDGFLGCDDRPVPVLHNGFSFATLVCSDFTDIQNRATLRGAVDALFVLEWNKDIGGFGYLLQSAVLDLHCLVVQVNNREYGDSWVRAPYRKEYKRDILRVKGGLDDYVVIGKFDFLELRRAQEGWVRGGYRGDRCSDEKCKEWVDTFKPPPIGYEIADFRLGSE